MTTQQFVDALNEKFSSLGLGRTYSIERPGVKYTRIVETGASQRSVYCFVDADGNIYKSASWKAPAKGVRATLATVNMDNVDPYGSWLYR
jgi:hypothetical protein